jgi:environmental stress-induced protein Ves
MEIIGPSQWITQPWRNGGGTTHEIFREGPADAFTFRLSIADVDRAGPFSLFAGVDRWIALLEGKGFALHRGELSRTIVHPFLPFRFSGDDAIDCTLLDGPVRDLNVMGARERVTLDVKSIQMFQASRFEPPEGATRRYAFVLGGPLVIDGERLERHELAVSEAEPAHIDGVGDVLLVWSTPRRA